MVTNTRSITPGCHMLFLKICPLINTIIISFYGQLWETYRAACNKKIYSNVNCKLVLADWIWVWKNIVRSCNYMLIFLPNVSKNTPEMTQGTLIKSLSLDLPLCLNSCHWSRLWKGISKFISFLQIKGISIMFIWDLKLLEQIAIKQTWSQFRSHTMVTWLSL